MSWATLSAATPPSAHRVHTIHTSALPTVVILTTAPPLALKRCTGRSDDDNDGYIQSMNSPLNTYILRLADVYLTYAEACLGNSEELTGGPGLEALNQVRDRARIPARNA